MHTEVMIFIGRNCSNSTTDDKNDVKCVEAFTGTEILMVGQHSLFRSEPIRVHEI